MQTLTQAEKKTNVDTIEIIISEKKTTWVSLRNQDWRKFRSETEKVNNLLTNIPINDSMDLIDLIYTEAKLFCEKSVSP